MNRATEMTKCEEYKLAIAADPASTDGAEHAEGCAECRAFAADIKALDGKIARAMSLSAPDLVMPELPDLDTEKVVSLTSRRRVSTPAWFAIAATVLLAAFIGVRMSNVGVPEISLADQLLAHIDHEKGALRAATTPVSDRRLSSVVPANVATMNHDSGLITYAQSCTINGNDVPHLVIQGERGPITILLMPHEAVNEAQSVDGESVQGVIIPVGSGSIAIIGEREEQLDNVKKSVLESVTWST